MNKRIYKNSLSIMIFFIFSFILLSICCFAEYSSKSLCYQVGNAKHRTRLYSDADTPRLAVRVNGQTLYAECSRTKEHTDSLAIRHQDYLYYVRKSKIDNLHYFRILYPTTGIRDVAIDGLGIHYLKDDCIRFYDLGSGEGYDEKVFTYDLGEQRKDIFKFEHSFIYTVIKNNQTKVYTIFYDSRSDTYGAEAHNFTIPGIAICYLKDNYLYYLVSNAYIYRRKVSLGSFLVVWGSEEYVATLTTPANYIAIDYSGIYSVIGSTVYHDNTPVINLPTNNTGAIEVDEYSNIYISSSEGVYVYTTDGEYLRKYTYSYLQKSLPSLKIYKDSIMFSTILYGVWNGPLNSGIVYCNS